jgi:AmiR/NasT family two-component response regulator
VGVIADTRADYLYLADALAACGQTAAWLRPDLSPVPRCDLVVWNARSLTRPLADEIAACRKASLGLPILLLLDSPRPDEFSLAHEAGVAAVIAKPFLLGDLRVQLSMALDERQRQLAA